MRFRLICNADPVALGIEDPNTGAWDLRAFEAHIKECTKCSQFTKQLTKALQAEIERRG